MPHHRTPIRIAPERVTPARPVNNGRGHPWTREEVLAAGLRWAELFDGPPACSEWDPAIIRRRIATAKAHVADLEARERAFADGEYPGTEAVKRAFGTTNAPWQRFVAALGFTPRARRRPTNAGRAEHREQARALAELGPLHEQLLAIIDRGGLTPETEIDYQLGRQAIGAERQVTAERQAALAELEATGLVERSERVVVSWQLTPAGRERLKAAA